MTAIDTTVELPAPTNLLNPPRFSPVVVTPAMFTLLVTVATPALILSICAVPLRNKSCHSLVESPRSCVASVAGIKSLEILALAVMVSELALPRLTLPPNEVTPATAKLLPRTAAPLMVVIPAIETPPCL